MSTFLIPGDYPGTITEINPAVADQVVLYKFMLPTQIEVSNIAVNVTASHPGTALGVGIYLLDWEVGPSLLIDSGPMPGTSTGVKTTSFTTVILPVGWYYWAFTANSGTVAIHGLDEDVELINLINADIILPGYGVAEFPSVAGQLPTTLGTVTASSGQIPFGFLF